jgi:glycerol-3-phosphate acyltransferase PlsY
MGYVALFLVSYFLGAVPFAYVVTKVLTGVDIRTVGSGNVGATNVRRAAGNAAAAVVLALDVAKGFVPAHFFPAWFAGVFPGLSVEFVGVLSGLGAILGHVFTVFLRFRGGKGVATSCGVAFGLAPLQGGIALGVFVLVVAVWRYISLGSMSAALAFLVSLVLLGKEPWGKGLPLTLFALAITALIVFRHRTNIGRLLAGTEHKLGRDKEATGPRGAQGPPTS